MTWRRLAREVAGESKIAERSACEEVVSGDRPSLSMVLIHHENKRCGCIETPPPRVRRNILG
jgi:hypothetical protein